MKNKRLSNLLLLDLDPDLKKKKIIHKWLLPNDKSKIVCKQQVKLCKKKR